MRKILITLTFLALSFNTNANIFDDIGSWFTAPAVAACPADGCDYDKHTDVKKDDD
jgi:hypothetical protein